MTLKNKMPLQIKVVLVVLWIQLLLSGLLMVALFRGIRSDIVRNGVEFMAALVFLFVIYTNYRLGAGSRWAYRFVQGCTAIAIARFIFNVAMDKSISPLQIGGFAVNVAVLMLLLTSASQAFYQRRT
jgi:hypothetical protein